MRRGYAIPTMRPSFAIFAVATLVYLAAIAPAGCAVDPPPTRGWRRETDARGRPAVPV
jgi:hypothetical protein